MNLQGIFRSRMIAILCSSQNTFIEDGYDDFSLFPERRIFIFIIFLVVPIVGTCPIALMVIQHLRCQETILDECCLLGLHQLVHLFVEQQKGIERHSFHDGFPFCTLFLDKSLVCLHLRRDLILLLHPFFQIGGVPFSPYQFLDIPIQFHGKLSFFCLFDMVFLFQQWCTHLRRYRIYCCCNPQSLSTGIFSCYHLITQDRNGFLQLFQLFVCKETIFLQLPHHAIDFKIQGITEYDEVHVFQRFREEKEIGTDWVHLHILWHFYFLRQFHSRSLTVFSRCRYNLACLWIPGIQIIAEVKVLVYLVNTCQLLQ